MDALSQQQSLGDGSIGGTKVGEKADTTILEEDEGDHIFLPEGDRGDNILGKENFMVLTDCEPTSAERDEGDEKKIRL